jgi:hypothetical protein
MPIIYLNHILCKHPPLIVLEHKTLCWCLLSMFLFGFFYYQLLIPSLQFGNKLINVKNHELAFRQSINVKKKCWKWTWNAKFCVRNYHVHLIVIYKSVMFWIKILISQLKKKPLLHERHNEAYKIKWIFPTLTHDSYVIFLQ